MNAPEQDYDEGYNDAKDGRPQRAERRTQAYKVGYFDGYHDEPYDTEQLFQPGTDYAPEDDAPEDDAPEDDAP